MEAEPTIEKYHLPHQSQKWSQLAAILNEISSVTSLIQAAQLMNKLNKDNKWIVSTLQRSGFPETRMLELIKFAAVTALQVENLFPEIIKISHPITEPNGRSYTVLTKQQALCLSTNMFFGTTFQQPNSKNLPIYYTFTRLTRRPTQVVRTYFNYLDRCHQEGKSYSQQSIVFFRLAETLDFNSWLGCQDKLGEVNFHKTGLIEDLERSVQIDFANKSIGGFFLSETYTQEDIIFINNPELMPALLFHKYMKANQCILMVGAERYSLYQGYLQTYQFSKNFIDQRPIIELELKQGLKVKVRDSWISAIDAIPWFQSSEFASNNLNRELNKAYIGFNIMNLDGGNKQISTGNWGSGAFNGNLEYKFLIQWLATSRSHRKMQYFSFQNGQARDIPIVVQKFKHLTVGELTQMLVALENHFQIGKKVFKSLFQKGLKSLKDSMQQQ